MFVEPRDGALVREFDRLVFIEEIAVELHLMGIVGRAIVR